jgi:hypothetical protein
MNTELQKEMEYVADTADCIRSAHELYSKRRGMQIADGR